VTVTYMVLPLYECTTEPLHAAAAETLHSAVDLLHSVADLAVAGATPTETSCLCVLV
jgi:hypothetical protein